MAGVPPPPHGVDMTNEDDRLQPGRLWSAALGALVPWVALLATVSLVEDELHAGAMPAFALLCLLCLVFSINLLKRHYNS